MPLVVASERGTARVRTGAQVIAKEPLREQKRLRGSEKRFNGCGS